MKFPDFGKNYKIIELIAKGGMAEVYRATYKPFGKPLGSFEKTVVLKKILSDHDRNQKWIDSFLSEAKIMARLSHSNIVQIYDFGKARGGHYLSLEYVDGGSLLDLMSSVPKLPKGIALYIGLEILKGLSYAHKMGVIHRDLSPSNILISREGEVKIADFGVAKLTSESFEVTQFLKGKRSYMSPEQLQRKPVSTASDLFTLGLILQELFGSNHHSFLKGVLAQNPKDRTQSCEAFEKVLLKAFKQEMTTQRAFSQYLSQYPKWQARKTLFISEMSPLPPKRSYAKKVAVLAVFAAIFIIIGIKVPAFWDHGYVSINAKPWGDVYFNDVFIGTTPLMKMKLPTGKHQIQIRNANLQLKKDLVINLSSNELKSYGVVLEPRQ